MYQQYAITASLASSSRKRASEHAHVPESGKRSCLAQVMRDQDASYKLATLGVYVSDMQNTDANGVDRVHARGYISGSFVVAPNAPNANIYAICAMLKQVDACFAVVFDGTDAFEIRGVDEVVFRSTMVDFKRTGDVYDDINDVITRFFLTYVDGSPHTNCYIDKDQTINRENLASFIIWESHWDKPGSPLESRLADAVCKAGFVVPV